MGNLEYSFRAFCGLYLFGVLAIVFTLAVLPHPPAQ